MTFNYSQGFVRRGLVGEVIRRLGGPRCYSYTSLALLGIALFLAAAVIMVVYVRRAVAVGPGDMEYWVTVMVLGASPGAVFFIHEIGYLDYVGFLALLSLVLSAGRLRRRYLLFPAVALAGILLAFIHEILVVLFVPPMFFLLLCVTVVELRGKLAPWSTRVRWALAVAVATLIPFAASATVGSLGTRPPAVIQALQATIATHADFPLRGDAFEVLYKPFQQILLKQMPYHWSFAENRAYLIAGFFAISPSLAFLLFYGIRVMRRVDTSAFRVGISGAFVAATLAPLFLNFVGWDNGRWNAISVIDGFCCIGIARLVFGAEVANVGVRKVGVGTEGARLTWTLGAMAISLGLCTNYANFLFDGFVVRWFPFTEPFRWR
jgi:hypothetical protein